MEAQFDEQAIEVLERAGEYFALETVGAFARSLRRQKLINTKQLLQSLGSQNRTDLARVVHSISFAFEQYGRYLDMKNKRWSTPPPIEKILDWVKNIGIEGFGADPRPNKFKPKTPERRMNEIAWGVAISMARRRTDKGRPWFSKNFYKSLNALQEELLLGIGDRTIEQMQETLLWRMKRGATGKYF